MKRLIPVGGSSDKTTDITNNLVESMLRYQPDKVKVAFCVFARLEDDWAKVMDNKVTQIEKFVGRNKKISYKLLTDENFIEVSAWADIIFMPGGDPYILKEKLEKHGDLKKLWDNKVIVGSSAGAMVMCNKYVYLQDKTIGQGFGWLEVSCLPHYGSGFSGYTQEDWERAELELLKQSPGQPVLRLAEGEFAEFTV
ncbi:hypothetical protein A3F37_01280 [Candidatus Saccharibacteria bacterium RIFCSPHIGHO2_12_FULL_41_12]|nr:MAG: hypothetical protein A3F37_01280 [Candidatus Saccharibacteria bacterium RIFCSPHIGHO2_12_FULL_41_12]